jgi:hypothetical protein
MGMARSRGPCGSTSLPTELSTCLHLSASGQTPITQIASLFAPSFVEHGINRRLRHAPRRRDLERRITKLPRDDRVTDRD